MNAYLARMDMKKLPSPIPGVNFIYPRDILCSAREENLGGPI
jgi:hypothetical protein